jgi:hypothetical protein
MRLALLAVALLAFWAEPAQASAWTLPHGHWQAFTTATASQAERTFDTAGRATIRTRFAKLLLQNCYEYGLTNALTIFATPAYGVAEIATPAMAGSRVQGGSIEVGARLALLARDGHFSAQLSYKNANAFDLSVAANGEPGHQAEARLLYGSGFVLFGDEGFADLQFAGRWMSVPRPSETLFDLTLGLWLQNDTMIMVQGFNTFGGGERNAHFSRYRMHKLEFSVVQRLSRHWSLQASVFYSPAGQNALRERGFSVSLWTQA